MLQEVPIFFRLYLLHPIYIVISRKTGSCSYSERILSICISRCNNESKDSTNSLCGKILIGLASDPVQIFLDDFMIVHEFADIQAIQSNKMVKRSSILYLILEEQIRVESVSHVLLKHHTFICVRCMLAESVTLSGLTENFPWIFEIYH